MNYIPITAEQRQSMLEVIGVGSIDELMADIPDSIRLSAPLDIAPGVSEMEVRALLESLAAQNRVGRDLVCFAGGGIYDHYRPAFLDSLTSRSEFFTAYTPYQPEVSQGTLQAIYEYQTGICELTGFDIANASMYDGATAAVEAGFMATRLVRGRRQVVVAGSIHPEYLETMATYAASGLVDFTVVPAVDGVVPTADLVAAVSDTTAAVIMGYPNYVGVYEDPAPVIAAAHAHGALAIAIANPIMLALVAAPASLGFDVAVGEGQPLGNAMSFGGPGLGFFSCTEACLRQIPGRIVGATVDAEGARGYVLTMSTREQHIRREKATSNICSNHSLNALVAGAYLAAAGRSGLRSVAESAFAKAHYLHDALVATGKFTSLASGPFGYEFAVRYAGDVAALRDSLLEAGILAGIVLNRTDLLVAVTEQRTTEEIDRFVKEVVARG